MGLDDAEHITGSVIGRDMFQHVEVGVVYELAKDPPTGPRTRYTV